MVETKEALISVIVPVYNGETYLADCIESIEQQTYRNLEIIIINDGSTDGTGKICRTLQEVYANIRVITMQDEGVSAARNVGLEASKGEYIAFVDADDRIRPDMLAILYECLSGTESDIAGCRFFIWENEEAWQAYAAQESEDKIASPRIFTPQEYIKDALLAGNSRCWSKLYRKEAISGIRFRRDLSIGEDMLFLLDMLPHVGKIAELAYPGYGYFRNPNGAINRKFTPKYMDQITCWEIARKQIRELEQKTWEKAAVYAAGKDSLYAQATALLIMGIMLTVGKIAVLSKDERISCREYTAVCRNSLKEALRVKGAFSGLSAGYRLKAVLFRCLPGLYILLYHSHKGGA